jgi:hypothetical protein
VSAREDLAARQASLVAALVSGAPVPPGLDAERVRIASAALLRKRGRSAARAEPELAAALGRSFSAAFAAYATGRPQLSPGGATPRTPRGEPDGKARVPGPQSPGGATPRTPRGEPDGKARVPGPHVGCSADDAGEFARFLLTSEYGRDREVRRIARHITLRRLLHRATRSRTAERAPSPAPLGH